MPGLPEALHRRCRSTLLRCGEFDRDASLRAVFGSKTLYPFRNALPGADSRTGRVDVALDYLLEKQTSDGRAVLPIFLRALRDRHLSGDALYDELSALAQQVETALAPASHNSSQGRGIAGDDKPAVKASTQRTSSVPPTIAQGGDDPSKRSPIRVSNPFGDTGRITDPTRFFDREEVLRQIFEELNKGVNLSLVGASQVGKSSLLSMICAQGPGKMPGATFRYLNLEWVEDEDEFYEAFCDALDIAVCRGYKLVRALREKRIVLCLDEIEKMTWDGFTVRLRCHLRGLADGAAAPLKLVIASRSPLGRLFPDAPELDSPLAGICRHVDIGGFPPDVSRAFLRERLRHTGVALTEAEISSLIAQSDGHPARLQRAASVLFAEKQRLQR